MKQKKGAIELSITTIIVIVLGITLLILGLGFIRGIFGNVEDISKSTFEKAKTMIDTLETVDSTITLSPSQITIEQSKDDVSKIILANLGEEPISLSVRIIPAQTDNKIDCFLYNEAGQMTRQAGPYLISSGTQERLSLIVKDKNGGITTSACKVLVEGLPPGQDNEDTLIIRVIKKQGLFS